MTASLTALAPLFALILIGLGLSRTGLIPAEGWRAVERLVYYVFFPVLLFSTVAEAELSAATALPLAGALLGAVAVMLVLLAAFRAWAATPGPAFTSLVQGAIRPNIYLGLGLAGTLYGNEGVVFAAIGLAIIVPSVNVVSVIALIRYAGQPDKRAAGLRAGLLAVVSNPLILAILAGAAVNAAGLRIEGVAAETIDILARPALPLGLIAVGANLRFDVMARGLGLVALASAGKLLILPAIAVGLGWAFGLGGAALAIATLWQAMPTAASSYVLARELGGDAELMAGIITVTTLAALVTLPLVLSVLA
jgi:hypothetical protein